MENDVEKTSAPNNEGSGGSKSNRDGKALPQYLALSHTYNSRVTQQPDFDCFSLLSVVPPQEQPLVQQPTVTDPQPGAAVHQLAATAQHPEATMGRPSATVRYLEWVQAETTKTDQIMPQVSGSSFLPMKSIGKSLTRTCGSSLNADNKTEKETASIVEQNPGPFDKKPCFNPRDAIASMAAEMELARASRQLATSSDKYDVPRGMKLSRNKYVQPKQGILHKKMESKPNISSHFFPDEDKTGTFAISQRDFCDESTSNEQATKSTVVNSPKGVPLLVATPRFQGVTKSMSQPKKTDPKLEQVSCLENGSNDALAAENSGKCIDSKEEVDKRQKRNRREQQRAHDISEQITLLQAVLQGPDAPVKTSKFEILSSAVKCIRRLQEHSNQLDAEKERLERTIQDTMLTMETEARYDTCEGELEDRSKTPCKYHAPRNATNANSATINGHEERGVPADLLKVPEINYRNVFHQCGVALGVASLDGKFLDCNADFERLSGYSRAELNDLYIFHLMNDSSEVEKACQEIIQKVRAIAGEKPGGGNACRVCWSGPARRRDCIADAGTSPIYESLLWMNVSCVTSRMGVPVFFNCSICGGQNSIC